MALTQIALSDTFKDWLEKTNLISTHLGDIALLNTTVTSSAVAAINSINNRLRPAADYATTNDLGATYLSGVLTSTVNERLVVDGFNTYAGERILVKDQPTASQNGIYDVTTRGSASVPWVLTRSSDFDVSGDISGTDAIFVQKGNNNENRGYMLGSNDPIVLDTDDIDWIRFTGAVHAGAGLSESANTLSVNHGNVHLEVNEDGYLVIGNDKIFPGLLHRDVAGDGLKQSLDESLAVDTDDATLTINEDTRELEVKENGLEAKHFKAATIGDIYVAGADGVWTKLAIGDVGSILTSNGSGNIPEWAGSTTTFIDHEVYKNTEGAGPASHRWEAAYLTSDQYSSLGYAAGSLITGQSFNADKTATASTSLTIEYLARQDYPQLWVLYAYNTTDTITQTFDGASDVNTGQERITIVGHGFSTGDAVLYDSNGNTELGVASEANALKSGAVYFVNKVNSNEFRLAHTPYEAADWSSRISYYPQITVASTGTHRITPVNVLDTGIMTTANGQNTNRSSTLTGIFSVTKNKAYIVNVSCHIPRFNYFNKAKFSTRY